MIVPYNIGGEDIKSGAAGYGIIGHWVIRSFGHWCSRLLSVGAIVVPLYRDGNGL